MDNLQTIYNTKITPTDCRTRICDNLKFGMIRLLNGHNFPENLITYTKYNNNKRAEFIKFKDVLNHIDWDTVETYTIPTVPKQLIESGYTMDHIDVQRLSLLKLLHYCNKELKCAVNMVSLFLIIKNHDHGWLNHFLLSAILKCSDSLPKLCILYGLEEGKSRSTKKREIRKGELNPAFNHGGKYSPFSKNFIKYQDATANYTTEDVFAKVKTTMQENPEKRNTTVEYYIREYGVDLETAKQMLSDRQTTFTLEKCIANYGEVEGRLIWQDRQDKWQQTLRSKDQEEIDRINMAKGTGYMNGIFNRDPKVKEITGTLYYIRFYNEETEFWKIGITSKSITGRFWKEGTTCRKSGLTFEVLLEFKDTFYNCFKLEQEILRSGKEHRMIVEFGNFNTTEAFRNDVHEIVNYVIETKLMEQ